MTATADDLRIAQLRRITALLDPPKPPATTRVCANCGQADRLLIPTSHGTFLCLNIDRCQP